MDTSNPLLKRATDFSLERDATATMTFQGFVNKTGILILLCLAAGAFSWTHPDLQGPLLLVGLIGGLVACLVGTFKPATTPIAAPMYAVLEGLCLGAISQMLDGKWHGIMVNAFMLTFGVLAVMLVLYTNRIIRVTNTLVKGIVIATASVLVVYVLQLVLRLFGLNVPFIYESGPIGIGFSLVVIGIAAFNLLLDFAVIETSVRNRAPKYMEWYCGMALLITLVWLYLEILRLLSKLRSR